MIVCGIYFGIAAIIIGYFYAIKDYWSPPYIFDNLLHIEDFIYGFLFGGIAAEVFEIVLPIKSIKRDKKLRKDLIIIFILVSIFCFIFFVNILDYNSIVAHTIPPLLVGIFCIICRKDFNGKIWKNSC